MSFHRLICIFAIALAVPCLAVADEDVPVADNGLFSRLDANSDGQVTADELSDGQSRLFSRMLRLGDANGDKSLDESEWQSASMPRRPAKPVEQKQSAEIPGADAARLLLLKLDTNENGVLTDDEIPEKLTRVFDDLVERYDRNNDNRVNSQELGRGGPQIARVAPRVARQMGWNIDKELARFDRLQGDKALRFTERQSPQKLLSNKDRMMEVFTTYDSNKDGKLELDELPDQARDRFSRFFRLGDKNRDGALNKKEFEAARQRAARFMRMTSGSPK